MTVPPRFRDLGRRPLFWAGGYAAWCVLLFILSSIRGISGPAIDHGDKIVHAVFFAAGHLLLGMAVRARRTSPWRRRDWWRIAMLLVIVAGVVGVLDEFHQSHTPGRHGNDPGDVAADITGGAIAAMLLPLAWRIVANGSAPPRARGNDAPDC